MYRNTFIRNAYTLLSVGLLASELMAQSVCLPSPRLLTTMPMGGQVGTTFDVKISGSYLEDARELSFSDSRITARQKLDENEQPVANTYVVTIADDCPTGIYDARITCRLGVSTARSFSVSSLVETTKVTAASTLDKAMPLQLNSVCNAVMSKESIDYYSLELQKGQRVFVECSASGIDSKLKPVLIIADAQGSDLVVQRRGGTLDFTAEEKQAYIVKVHDLTYNGGTHYFYRLTNRELKPEEKPIPIPATRSVSSFSWPPAGLENSSAISESEPNNQSAEAQKITLPCDISGSFFPAADVDIFEFTAKKGEIWWVEVASERLGLPTDPFVVVQQVDGGQPESVTDVAELSDIPTPVKVSTNGYSYDGPPYNAGSTDVLGKLEIKESGVHRLRLTDLFGGTRNDPRNVYRLIIRKANPDFALVGWALHMGLRNGDRNALSKPVALRAGTTMAVEVVVVRRDGFDGEIELVADDLPEGVSATGLKIPAGKTRGILLFSADLNAPAGYTIASLHGEAVIDGKPVMRPLQIASMKWPVKDARSEIPAPRLLADVPVSVCESEFAPIVIGTEEEITWEVGADETLKIPLVLKRSSEFSGANISLKTYGAGFEKTPAFDVSLTAETAEATLDISKLKVAPGDYVIAFYGKAVAKYRYNPQEVIDAEKTLDDAKRESEELEGAAKKLSEIVKTTTGDEKSKTEKLLAESSAKQKAAAEKVSQANKRFVQATASAKPKDIVDIIISTPIKIRVKPGEKK